MGINAPSPEEVKEFVKWIRREAPSDKSGGVHFLYGAEALVDQEINTWAVRVGPQGESNLPLLDIRTLEQKGSLSRCSAQFDAATGEPAGDIGKLTADTFTEVKAAFQNGRFDKIKKLTESTWLRK